MQAEQFLNRYLLRPLPATTPQPLVAELRRSAVLVPLLHYADELHLLLTRRALTLAHHPGQISFPGGMLETGETAIQAACREAEEEIGLPATTIRVLGELQPLQTLTGFHISPVVALVTPGQAYRLNQQEVSEVFEVPLSFFLNPASQQGWPVWWRGKQQHLTVIPYQDKLIWGATAGIIQQLLTQIR
ncbi:NUDIX hydrolase [Alishewanella aestuarii B11]|uniref:NUDIX hydrolase n=1 Tax=Alishewanella aestuarii B11 TaxID=1197174 RepID=J1QEQ8_9ALTE|nr:CoA pyrophosphatase [Alishewanella aestuarii]EJI83971.1 NUDIX hydrolase [Alishewanella aestuarii B11]